MNTEHIVQFAIGFDDESIKRNIKEHAEKEIIKSIKQDVADKLFRSRYGYEVDSKSDPLSDFSQQIVIDVFEKHKNEIVNKAAIILADKLIRTKAAKEALADAIDKAVK